MLSCRMNSSSAPQGRPVMVRGSPGAAGWRSRKHSCQCLATLVHASDGTSPSTSRLRWKGRSRSKMASLVPAPSEASTNTGTAGCRRATRPASCMVASDCLGRQSPPWSGRPRPAACRPAWRATVACHESGCGTTAGRAWLIDREEVARYSRRRSRERRSRSSTRSNVNGAGLAPAGGTSWDER